MIRYFVPVACVLYFFISAADAQSPRPTVKRSDGSTRQLSDAEGAAGAFGGLLCMGGLVCGGILLYVIPSIIAIFRQHHNAAAIIAVNVLLGWSFLGWVAAFVWSLTAVRR